MDPSHSSLASPAEIMETPIVSPGTQQERETTLQKGTGIEINQTLADFSPLILAFLSGKVKP